MGSFLHKLCLGWVVIFLLCILITVWSNYKMISILYVLVCIHTCSYIVSQGLWVYYHYVTKVENKNPVSAKRIWTLLLLQFVFSYKMWLKIPITIIIDYSYGLGQQRNLQLSTFVSVIFSVQGYYTQSLVMYKVPCLVQACVL